MIIKYVAERGCYEDRRFAGAFDTPEQAMAALPGNKWRRTIWTHHPNWPDLSVVWHHQSWDNDLDWDDAVSITETQVLEQTARRLVDETVLQTLRDDGGWDYVPVSTEEADHIMAEVHAGKKGSGPRP